jgi:hypothetical protein
MAARQACCFAVLSIGGWQLQATDMPVKQVILYKHGIGFFEREGVVPAGDEIRLDFQNNDMNDVLKSLTVTDLSGGRVTSVRYDSNETPEQRLAKFPFQVGDTEFLSTFLDRLKGAKVELKLSDKTVSGAILSARPIETGGENNKRVVREQVTLLLDSGDLANFGLDAVDSMRLLDPHLQEQLKQYLQTLGQAKSRENRSVYIASSDKDARHLKASYIAPTAIWKSSYRLTLHDADSTLEGWAIVDNTTGEDWTDVRLAVVSGRPISFISLLDTPRYGQRQVAELPEDRAAGPVVYSGVLDKNAPEEGGAAGGVIGGVVGGVGEGAGRGDGAFRVGKAKHFSTNDLMAPSAGLTPRPVPAPGEWNSLESSVAGATGATLGELFEYNFAGTVTIKKNQSAMLPFLQDKVTARKLLIYSSERDGEHPVNAAELVNKTDKTLDGGPITVYDGGAYAGEALFETLKAGDERLVGYAVDYGTRIDSTFGTRDQTIREIHAKNGTLQFRYSVHQTRVYSAKNVDSKPKTLIVEQPIAGYTVLTPKPSERTSSAYRFQIDIPANGTQRLQVEQEQVTFESTVVSSATPDYLLTILQNKELSEAGRKQLGVIADLKRKIAATEDSVNSTKSQLDDLGSDQARLRQNLDSLNRVKGQEEQVRKYSIQLGESDGQIAKLRDQHRELAVQKASLDAQLRDVIEKLDF